jgi:uncharacterized membrane protein
VGDRVASFFAGPVMTFAGVMHFAKPRWYMRIMPPYLPAHRALVYASGVAEIAGGVAMLPERSARWGAWWLIATLVAVFPANVNMAVNAQRFRAIPAPLLWLRLPVQGLLVAWVHKVAIRNR